MLGLWSFLIKLASNQLGWHQIFVLSNIIYFIFTLGVYLYFKPELTVLSLALTYIVFAGLAGSLGTITFFMALKAGKASMVVPLTALYPAVAVVLSVLILHESLTFQQALGVTLAIIAVMLIST